MRKKLFLVKASCAFITLLFAGLFATHTANGQTLFSANALNPNNFLYSWCAYLFDANNTTVDLPLLKISSLNFIPGPCLFFVGSGFDTVNKLAGINFKGFDSTITIPEQADSAEVKDLVSAATTQPVIPTITSEATYQKNGKSTISLSGASFDEETDMLINKYADMISITPDEVNNFHLYKFIDQWYGVRYKWGGNDNSGIDCSGFSQKLYGSIYSLSIMRTARQQHRSCETFKDYDDAAEGDLVFFRAHHLGISHVGIYLANGYFVHASRSRGVVISNLEEKYWRRRYAGCGRIEREDISVSESGLIQ